MVYWWNYRLGLCLLVISTFLAGCARGGAGTPAPSAQPSASADVGQPGLSSSEIPSSARSGSLEAFQRGAEMPSDPSSPLDDVYFGFDEFTLRPEARQTLNANARWLESNPGRRIEIEGHADERGTNEYNLALGARRAQAVKDYLSNLGISPDRMSTISYGEELPVCRTLSESCWQRNRRAHFVIIGPGPAS